MAAPLTISCHWFSNLTIPYGYDHAIVVVHSLSHVRFFATPWTAACQASLSSIIFQSLLKFKSIEFLMLSIISFSVALFFCLQFFPALGSFPMSHLHIRCQNYWSFSFSISPSDEYSGLISFRTDWFDLLAVQGALQSLLQHHSSKASVLQHSAFFMTTSSPINIPSSSPSERHI